MTPFAAILILVAAVGLTWSLGAAAWLRPLRDRWILADKMLSCPLCLGFHCGWICCLLYLLSPWLLLPLAASLASGIILRDKL